MIPWGEPLSILVTSYCFHCGSSYLSLREATEEGISGAAQQLAEHFLQVVPGSEFEGMQTTH